METVTINNVDTGIDENACNLAGNDAGDFTCTANDSAYVLAFTSAPNYEAPADSNGDNLSLIHI